VSDCSEEHLKETSNNANAGVSTFFTEKEKNLAFHKKIIVRALFLDE